MSSVEKEKRMEMLSFKDTSIDTFTHSSYDIHTFIHACKAKKKVFVSRGAQEDASRDLGLHGTNEILFFLAFGGLDCELEFVNTKEWENDPDPSHMTKVDAYTFLSDYKRCYLAFLRFSPTGNWLIKSLHLEPGSNEIMVHALKLYREKRRHDE